MPFRKFKLVTKGSDCKLSFVEGDSAIVGTSPGTVDLYDVGAQRV